MSDDVNCSIVYGSIAQNISDRQDPRGTHEWSLYVRGSHGGDLSLILSKVTFVLHPSFAVPARGSVYFMHLCIINSLFLALSDRKPAL
jgi:hypothetical protein